MDKQEVIKYATGILKEQEHHADNIRFFTHLVNCNIVDYNLVMKGCINHLYDHLLRQNNSTNEERVLDCAIEFHVSETVVKNCIYKQKHIRLDFNL